MKRICEYKRGFEVMHTREEILPLHQLPVSCQALIYALPDAMRSILLAHNAFA